MMNQSYDIYELKPEIGYNEETGYIAPFKVCNLKQIICQDEDAITPEDILKNPEDIVEVKKALKVVAKFIRTADESECWYDD